MKPIHDTVGISSDDKAIHWLVGNECRAFIVTFGVEGCIRATFPRTTIDETELPVRNILLESIVTVVHSFDHRDDVAVGNFHH